MKFLASSPMYFAACFAVILRLCPLAFTVGIGCPSTLGSTCRSSIARPTPFTENASNSHDSRAALLSLAFGIAAGFVAHRCRLLARRATQFQLDIGQRKTFQLRDPYSKAKAELNMMAPLVWPREECEIIVDATNLTFWYFQKAAKAEGHDPSISLKHDPFCFWPIRIYNALKVLVPHYGKSRPPSPWKPVMGVWDLPNPGSTWSGLQVKRWKNLSRQGPRPVSGLTLAFSQTYVDRSAEENYRADKEIMYLLEILTRDFSRRQILVTADRTLAKQARNYATVRGPSWFEQEVLSLGGEEGKNAIKALMGGSEGVQEAKLPYVVWRAFTAA